MKKSHFNLAYVAFALGIIFLVQALLAYQTIATLNYSDFIRYLEEGKVASVIVTESRIEGAFREAVEGKSLFVAQRVEPDFASQLQKYDVQFGGASDQNWFTSLLSWILPTLILVGVWFLFFRGFAERQDMGGLVNIGKSRAKVYVERDTGVTFKDVAGVDEAKAELQEVVSFLDDRDKYGRLGARIPKGILLVGPPGTGKTLLARAIAGEAGVSGHRTRGVGKHRPFLADAALGRVHGAFRKLCAPDVSCLRRTDA
jgi:cell division protease FtsH